MSKNEKPKINKEKVLDKMKEDIKKGVIAESQATPEMEELYNEALKVADMPVAMKDEDFILGKQELDIRGLSKENQVQMMFRQFTLMIVYLKQIMTSVIDFTRLEMVIADKLGVEDLIQATDDILEKTKKIRKDLNGFVKDKPEA